MKPILLLIYFWGAFWFGTLAWDTPPRNAAFHNLGHAAISMLAAAGWPIIAVPIVAIKSFEAKRPLKKEGV